MKEFITAEKANEMATNAGNKCIKSILEHLNTDIIEKANNGETNTVYYWQNNESGSVQAEIKKILRDKGYTVDTAMDGRNIFIFW